MRGTGSPVNEVCLRYARVTKPHAQSYVVARSSTLWLIETSLPGEKDMAPVVAKPGVVDVLDVKRWFVRDSSVLTMVILEGLRGVMVKRI